MQDAMIQRLAEKDPQYYGAQLAGTLTVASKSAAGAIKDIKFLDTDTCFWQLTQQQSMQHKANAADLIPYLGTHARQLVLMFLDHNPLHLHHTISAVDDIYMQCFHTASNAQSLYCINAFSRRIIPIC